MKWILRTSVPAVQRMLLIESGPREAAENSLTHLRARVCGDAPIDLLTCLPDNPDGLGEGARAWRTYDCRNHAERWRMLRELRKERHTAAAILSGGSPLLAGWKVVAAALLPAKILLIDDSGGLVWLDRGHWRDLVRLGVAWTGVRNPDFLEKALHVAALPFQLCLLLAFAAKVHLGRLARSADPGDQPRQDRIEPLNRPPV